MPDRMALEVELADWLVPRNAKGAPIARRFNTADARIKLRRLYPSFQA